ncbi:hypothetical protein BC828DRAFT_185914 [Blastocladiella britannica]|nr:hypothetical protein BC828DRAFT_185914 [Blastocladiella britannica]
MKLLPLIVALVATLATSSGVRAEDAAAAAAVSADSDVLTLTEANFKSSVDPEKLVLVEFYAPWCGHCKQLAPEYEKAATALKPDGIKLAKVDCPANADLCSEYKIEGYPTMKIFREGKVGAYNGGRTEDTIIGYMRKQSLPALSTISAAQVADFAEKDRYVVIGYIPEGHADATKALETVANQLRDDHVFAVTSDKAALPALGLQDASVPAVVALRKFDEPMITLISGSAITAEDLTAAVKRESMPTMDEVSPANYMKYIEDGKPMAFFFYSTAEERALIGPKIEAVARNYKGKFNFVYCDSAKFGGHAQTMNLKEQWPAFGVSKVDENLKWPFDQTKEITEAAIAEFIADIDSGKLESSIKSEPIPAEQPDAVITVVGHSFKDVVLDTKKDVFVEFYAPWCGHCKKIAPTWEKLAAGLKDQADKVVIAKMDGTENDLPADAMTRIEGFPTIKLFRAGDNEGVLYNGDRTIEDFAQFLAKNAKNTIDTKFLADITPDSEEEGTPAEEAHSEL